MKSTIGSQAQSDERTNMVKCIPFPISEGTKLTCKNPLTNQTIDCSEATVQTVATLSCHKYYSPKFRISQIQMTCTSNGQWEKFRPFSCETNCGILSSDVTALITFAQETSRKNAFPWHAAIFRERENHPGQFLYTCGGSLIERTIILTAAHCLNDVVKSPQTISKYRIVLAPLSTNYEANLSDKLAKIYNIKQIKVPAGYDFKTLKSDIAIVQLTEPVIFGPHIRPICYLLDSSLNPSVGKLGKVPGFGINENGEISYYLKFATLPIVSRSECLLASQRDIPPATFCTGYRNGTSVCRGDSGGGFAIPENGGDYERYSLKGIVSAETSDPNSPIKCGSDSYSIFTHVGTYKEWILKTLDELES